ncbi:hypothetical protein TNCT_126791 [Trichonephila clavata]|uniref:Uncharacterized protein n=1 Tax=Trichonephila clavata TaxID=2740835 RepID=A0A8X6LJC2_TRICU|nr:hypothetical protein TNCT_126791 [Trichonephila clavata]
MIEQCRAEERTLWNSAQDWTGEENTVSVLFPKLLGPRQSVKENALNHVQFSDKFISNAVFRSLFPALLELTSDKSKGAVVLSAIARHRWQSTPFGCHAKSPEPLSARHILCCCHTDRSLFSD